eukprot:750671-Hanusia_phi.AAC.1
MREFEEQVDELPDLKCRRGIDDGGKEQAGKVEGIRGLKDGRDSSNVGGRGRRMRKGMKLVDGREEGKGREGS